MIIAFQGELGAYSEEAALLYSGSARTLPRPSFGEVFSAVTGGYAELGILPVENSIGGTIHKNYDLLLECLSSGIQVIGEVELAVNHYLLALQETTFVDLKVVSSHPQALAQCEQYLRRLQIQLGRNFRVEEAYDTAGAAKIIAKDKVKGAAAIASRRAGEIYGLQLLAERIQDFHGNVTRFVVIAHKPEMPAEANKAMVVFTLANRVGALAAVLNLLAFHGINLTKLESRPQAGKPFEYFFYAELECAPDVLGEVMPRLGQVMTSMEILGHYPRWK